MELDPELMQEVVDGLVAREPQLARFLVNDPEGVDKRPINYVRPGARGVLAAFRAASPGVELDPELMQEVVDGLVAREPQLARFLVNDPEGVDKMLLQFPIYLDYPDLRD